MPSVHKSVLVQHGAPEMFDLVQRIEDYPRFLPWCAGTTIIEHSPETVVARIDIDYHGVRAHFTTANRNRAPDRIDLTLRDGPFERLDGTWQFRTLQPGACKVEFDLDYDFATPVLARLVGPVFSHIAETFIEAFVKRADSADRIGS